MIQNLSLQLPNRERRLLPGNGGQNVLEATGL